MNLNLLKGQLKMHPNLTKMEKKLHKKQLNTMPRIGLFAPTKNVKFNNVNNVKQLHIILVCPAFKINNFKQPSKYRCNSRKCRYCKEALKKGYTSHLGIKSFDNICNKK